MAKRDLTLAEIQAMLDAMGDKITEEASELYGEVTAKVNAMYTAASSEMDQRINELRPKLQELYTKVSGEARDIVSQIEAKMDALHDDIQEEIAELKEVGLANWIKLNPALAAGIGAVVILVIIAVVSLV